MDARFQTHDLRVAEGRCRKIDEEGMKNAVIRTFDWKFILDSKGLLN